VSSEAIWSVRRSPLMIEMGFEIQYVSAHSFGPRRAQPGARRPDRPRTRGGPGRRGALTRASDDGASEP
jgi:hypothetical protein